MTKEPVPLPERQRERIRAANAAWAKRAPKPKKTPRRQLKHPWYKGPEQDQRKPSDYESNLCR